MSKLTFMFAAAAAVAAAPAAFAGAAPEEAASMLYERGYRYIQIDPDHRPGYRAFACKKNTHFRIRIDKAGRIVDVDPVGACHAKKGPRDVRVNAPFTDVRVGRKGSRDVRVKAPFTDVKVGKKGVRVRAPFVDIRIPR